MTRSTPTTPPLPGAGLLFTGPDTVSPPGSPTPAPTLPADPENNFRLGEANSNVCLGASIPIREESVCAEAAAAFGYSFRGSEEVSTYPSGCYRWGLRSVYYNTHTPGSARSDSRLICAKPTGSSPPTTVHDS